MRPRNRLARRFFFAYQKGGFKILFSISKTFYVGEGVAEIMTWNNGLRKGNWEQYFSDGKLKLRGNYDNDENEGEITAYYPSGKMLYSGNYHDGLRIGTWIYYDDKGNVEKKEIYKNGVIVKEEETGKGQ